MFKPTERDIDRNHFLMKPSRVKNMNAAPIQVTAEQIVLDGQIHQEKVVIAPSQKVMDDEELESYKLRKRTEFEQMVKMKRHYLGNWIKYALWEENIKEIQRCRSIFERCLEVDYKCVSTWLKYVDMEMRNKFVNHARNLWERCVTLLPRVDQFWYKYSYMEELLGNYSAARSIFERWMSWKPEERGWLCYLKFEERMGEKQRHREVMYKFLVEFPRQATYIKVAKYEMRNKNIPLTRQIFEKAAEDLGLNQLTEDYYIEFAKFEIRIKEDQRAREIFKFGLDRLNNNKKLYQVYLNFEKKQGQKEEIDSLILDKRRQIYLQKIDQTPLNYDAWFDLINLELTTNNILQIRETFEKAVQNVPPSLEKRFWRRYIYIWYNYAIFEETDANDHEKAEQVYKRALDIVPHKQFTFAKLWIMAAHFQIRILNVDKARIIFGNAIGRFNNEKIFKAYIDLELQLANVDRCRKLYESWISKMGDQPIPWVKYAELEKQIEEVDRAREIYELAVNQVDMNMPETLWKSYIDMEIELKDYDRVRNIYQRLLEKTKHVKVWISYAQFEADIQEFDKARDIYNQSDKYFKQNTDLKEERIMLLENWREMENKINNQENLNLINQKMPKRIKKQRRIKIVEGDQEEDAGFEEYYDYIFPDDQNQLKNLKILQKAYNWKQNNI